MSFCYCISYRPILAHAHIYNTIDNTREKKEIFSPDIVWLLSSVFLIATPKSVICISLCEFLSENKLYRPITLKTSHQKLVINLSTAHCALARKPYNL